MCSKNNRCYIFFILLFIFFQYDKIHNFGNILFLLNNHIKLLINMPKIINNVRFK